MCNNKNVLIMKKLGKITINPEQVIKDEELVNLKGGYDGWCTCYIEWGDWTQKIENGCGIQDCNECERIMRETWPYSQAVSVACE
jgi:natural product precursor